MEKNESDRDIVGVEEKKIEAEALRPSGIEEKGARERAGERGGRRERTKTRERKENAKMREKKGRRRNERNGRRKDEIVSRRRTVAVSFQPGGTALPPFRPGPRCTPLFSARRAEWLGSLLKFILASAGAVKARARVLYECE